MVRNGVLRLAFALLLLGVASIAVSADAARAQDRAPKPLVFEEAFRDGPVVTVRVDGLIDNALSRYIDRAIAEAEGMEAAVVVFEIDTFGGLVDAADAIRKSILQASIPTVAFIDRNAASAGALISYAADRIVMVPGASIGAATVVEGTSGAAAPDKYQSYMRGLMRATAEANGRDPRIAEAMVDENLEVEGVSPEGQVLTLSANEALRHGVADAILESTDQLIAELDLPDRPVLAHHASMTERVLRFFGSPILQSLLMLMMLGGLYFELQTPGVGFPGLMATIGAALFFAPHYLLGLVESWEIVLFGIGVVLILAEVFLIPGFGVAGVSGLVLVVGSLIAALIANVGLSFPSIQEVSSAVMTMAVTLVLLVTLIFSLGRYLPRSQRFNQLVLVPDLSAGTGYVSSDAADHLLGAVGTTVTPLRPGGAVELSGERVEVTSGGEYIPPGTPVQVVRVRGSRVEVRRVRAEEGAAHETSRD